MYELPPATHFNSNRICQWGLPSAARLKWETPLPWPPQGLPARRKAGRRRHTRGGSEGVAPPRGEGGENGSRPREAKIPSPRDAAPGVPTNRLPSQADSSSQCHISKAVFRPRGMEWGGRREEGSGWGTHVYLWRIHFDIWQI